MALAVRSTHTFAKNANVWGTRLLALFITEKVLWGVRLTPLEMTAVFVFVEVVANLVVWLVCARLLRSLRQRRAGKTISPASL